jgi:hypothetical protein
VCVGMDGVLVPDGERPDTPRYVSAAVSDCTARYLWRCVPVKRAGCLTLPGGSQTAVGTLASNGKPRAHGASEAL